MGVTKLDKHMSRQTIPEMVQEQIKGMFFKLRAYTILTSRGYY